MSEEEPQGSGMSDAETLEQLEARLAELLAIQAADEADDERDAPESRIARMASIETIELYRPLKHPTTVRIDADVLFWLKSGGPGYQTRLNAILREAMIRDLEAFEGELNGG